HVAADVCVEVDFCHDGAPGLSFRGCVKRPEKAIQIVQFYMRNDEQATTGGAVSRTPCCPPADARSAATARHGLNLDKPQPLRRQWAFFTQSLISTGVQRDYVAHTPMLSAR